MLLRGLRRRKDRDNQIENVKDSAKELLDQDNKLTIEDHNFLSIRVRKGGRELINLNIPINLALALDQLISTEELSKLKAAYGLDIAEIVSDLRQGFFENNILLDHYNERTGIKIEVYIS